MCVQIGHNGQTVVATVVDECPGCASNHLDLSLTTASALGLPLGTTTGMDDPKTGVTWKAVDCPVSGNIVVTFNSPTSQIYFQNVAFPVASASAGGHTATQRSGFWDFGANVAGQTVTLKDAVGHTITGTIPSSAGSIGAQFPLTCQ